MAIYNINTTEHLQSLIEKYATQDVEANHFIITSEDVESGRLPSLCKRIKQKVYNSKAEDSLIHIENSSERIGAVVAKSINLLSRQIKKAHDFHLFFMPSEMFNIFVADHPADYWD